MKTKRFLLTLLLATSALSSSAHADTDWSQVGWLAGCWAGEFGEPGTTEQWMAPAGGGMLGMSRVVRRGQIVDHEFLQIRVNAEGRFVYIAKPHNQAEATFTLKEARDRSLVFEDLAHDFPQRVMYRAIGEDRLMARIEGEMNGKQRGIDFPMRRTSCG